MIPERRHETQIIEQGLKQLFVFYGALIKNSNACMNTSINNINMIQISMIGKLLMHSPTQVLTITQNMFVSIDHCFYDA